ncbi:MAG: homocysteine S-methyltransferase family protein [Oscillospiraceae bacterium]|nr:homocysteine S-methyltransferase family protein [Oscillospiraceae bacterium]
MSSKQLTDKMVILDGAMGTMLQRSGLQLGKRPELLNLEQPTHITEIHKQYAHAGAQIIYANTFGANAHKLQGLDYSVEEVIFAGIKAAKAVEGVQVALDIGPIGQLLEPTGTLPFEEAEALYTQMIKAGVLAGADLIIFETMTDLYEVKAAVLAAKAHSTLPVWVSMTFEENGRTFTGCSVEAMAATLQGLGVDALGINCSLGPKEIYPLAKRLCSATALPVFIKANAGLPNLSTNEYDIDAEMFCEQMEDFAKLGIFAMGGCCGTTPAYIKKLSEKYWGKAVQQRVITPKSVVCTSTNVVEIEGVTIIGERINPTGKKQFKQALLNKDYDYIMAQAIAQIDAGANILDVNVGMPEVDEKAMMVEVIKRLQAITDLPLQIDSSDADVIEAALHIYNGKAIVNSVNGEQKKLDEILPIVKKYGAAVVGLTLDENGIPAKAQQRFEIAQRILNTALQYGICKEDVYIDCLTLTASAQQEAVTETLKAVKMVKEQLGLHTVLGVSNISFGLPNRELINSTFLTLAMQNGLDLPIMNPNVKTMMDTVFAFNVLYNRDKNSVNYIERFPAAAACTPTPQAAPVEGDITLAIKKGLKAEARQLAYTCLEQMDELDLVNRLLIPALDEVGTAFEKGTMFLPQLIQSANAAQAAFDVVKEKIAKKGGESVSKGKIVIATVKGDIHDIGKNIVKVILENYGYQMIDLGRDVPIEKVVETVKQEKVKLVGLSALMTTTLKSMEETIAALRAENLPCKVFVGGAVLTPEYALQIGADFYAKDAKQSVDIAKKVLDL